MSAVDVAAVRHAFSGVDVLQGVSLEVPEGSYTVFLGPSGSGKTTLLNLIGGFLALQDGSIAIGGVDMADTEPAQRPTATVFQDYALFPHMSVGANVGFGLRMAGRRAAERRQRVAEMLAMVGLPDAAHRRPHQLSGGQRQRVALARALAVSPQVLLLDEPLGALDLALRRQMQDELKRIQQEVGGTFIHVTHDQDEALAMADQLVVMAGGRITDVGDPQTVYDSPTTLFTAGFVGRSNRVPGQVSEVADGMATVATALGPLRGRDTSGALRRDGAAEVVLRPEHLVMGTQGAGVSDAGAPGTGTDGERIPGAVTQGPAVVLPPGEVVRHTFAGAHRDAEVQMADGTCLLVQLPAGAAAPVGPLSLRYQAASAVVLPAGRP